MASIVADENGSDEHRESHPCRNEPVGRVAPTVGPTIAALRGAPEPHHAYAHAPISADGPQVIRFSVVPSDAIGPRRAKASPPRRL